MTILFSIIFALLIAALITVIVVLTKQTKNEKKEKLVEFIQKTLEAKGVVVKNTYFVNNELILAINKKETKLAVIQEFDVASNSLKYFEINTNFITSIEKTMYGINIEYVLQGNKDTLFIQTKSKEIENLIHELYKAAGVRKLAEKYMINSFPYSTSSDWECSFIWAYKPTGNSFAYYKTTEKQAIYKLNLLKEFFTIDVKYNYFEAPVLGIAQQLSVYDTSFLNEIFISLLNDIKQKTTTVFDNRIYYDTYRDCVYLTNGTTSLQSVLLGKIEDVYYKEDRLTFSLVDEEKVINFLADKFMLEEFENFTTTYNLRKIAQSFDYTVDKLINTTEGTKFIIDYSRDRVVYCAGLNSFAKFNYMTIMFYNLENAEVVKTKEGQFVRIYTKDKNIIDVSCKKASVAQYILAQIKTIIS